MMLNKFMLWNWQHEANLHYLIVLVGLARLDEVSSYAGRIDFPGRSNQAGQVGTERPAIYMYMVVCVCGLWFGLLMLLFLLVIHFLFYLKWTYSLNSIEIRVIILPLTMTLTVSRVTLTMELNVYCRHAQRILA